MDGYEKNAKTHKYIRIADQETVANKAYADRTGNGSIASGDGWKYRGRGLFQVTFRANYAGVSRLYGKLYGGNLDFEKNPDLMAESPYDIRSAVCFWIIHRLYKLADLGDSGADVDRITKVVNLHTDSYGNRRTNFKVAYDAFK